MKKASIVAVLGLAAGAMVFTLTGCKGSGTAKASSNPPRRILFYRDPMHPSYTSEKPGKAPDCGMALEPVYADDASMGGVNAQGTAQVVQLSSEQQQLIGVKLGHVEKSRADQMLRAFGRIALDETRVFPVIANGDGYVNEIYPNLPDSKVKKGNPLVSVYGREYMNAQRTYIYQLRSLDQPAQKLGEYQEKPSLRVDEAKLILEKMGIAPAEIEQLAKTKQPLLNNTIVSPASGVLVARNVLPKQKFTSGAELFRVADISKLWVVVDVFGDDISLVRPGSTATVMLKERPGMKFRARVADTIPRFDSESRSQKVRLQVENPKLILRPDMLVDVEFRVQMPEATTVPPDAVVEYGLKKTVFVERKAGVFEPREVETGWQRGNQVEILSGLKPGETIVVSGNFLLDSESRMRQTDAKKHD